MKRKTFNRSCLLSHLLSTFPLSTFITVRPTLCRPGTQFVKCLLSSISRLFYDSLFFSLRSVSPARSVARTRSIFCDGLSFPSLLSLCTRNFPTCQHGGKVFLVTGSKICRIFHTHNFLRNVWRHFYHSLRYFLRSLRIFHILASSERFRFNFIFSQHFRFCASSVEMFFCCRGGAFRGLRKPVSHYYAK